MQVRLITTIETIIDVDPKNDATLEEARREILGRLHEAIDQDSEQEQYVEAVQCLHTGCVVFDQVRTQTVTHSFSKVEGNE